MTQDVHIIDPLGMRQYMDQHREGDYVLVDVRQPDEYLGGHIPGSVLMPLGDAATAEGYIARLESWMHQKNDQSLAEAGVFAHVVALDSNAPIETVRHIHGIAHA